MLVNPKASASGIRVRPLLLEQVRAGLLGLVGLVGELASRPAGVPADDHRGRVVVDQHLREHRGEPVNRVGGPPVVGRNRFGQREEGAVGEVGVAVDQEEFAGLFCGADSFAGAFFWVVAGTGPS